MEQENKLNQNDKILLVGALLFIFFTISGFIIYFNFIDNSKLNELFEFDFKNGVENSSIKNTAVVQIEEHTPRDKVKDLTNMCLNINGTYNAQRQICRLNNGEEISFDGYDYA